MSQNLEVEQSQKCWFKLKYGSIYNITFLLAKGKLNWELQSHYRYVATINHQFILEQEIN